MADLPGLGTLIDKLIVALELDLTGFSKNLGVATAQAEAAGAKIREALEGKFGAGSAAALRPGDALNAALVAPMIAASAQAQKTNREIRGMLVEITAQAKIAGDAISTAVEKRAGLGGPERRAAIASGEVAAAGAGRAAFDNVMGSGPPATPYDGDIWDSPNGKKIFKNGFWYDAAMVEAAERKAAQAAAAAAGMRGGGAAGEGAAFGAGAGIFEKLFGGKNGARMAGNAARGAAQGMGFGAFAGTAGALGEGAAAGGMAAALTTIAGLVGPLGMVATAVAAIGAVFVASNWDHFVKLGDRIAEVWEARVGPALAQVGKAVDRVKEAFRIDDKDVEIWAKGWEMLARIASDAVAIVLNVVGAVIDAFASAVKIVRAIVAGDWAEAWKEMQAGSQRGLEAVLRIVDNAIDAILSVFAAFRPSAEKYLRETYEAAKHWLGDKFEEIAERVGKITKQVGDYFKELWDRVVGHSYVPDMVDGIESEFDRLDRVMVQPAEAATKKVNGLFADMAAAVNDNLAAGFGDVLRGTLGAYQAGDKKVGKNVLGGAIGLVLDGIGSAFGGMFADGGTLAPGQWGIAGERGPELIFGGKSGLTIHPNAANSNIININVDARGAGNPAAVAMAVNQAIAAAEARGALGGARIVQQRARAGATAA